MKMKQKSHTYSVRKNSDSIYETIKIILTYDNYKDYIKALMN